MASRRTFGESSQLLFKLKFNADTFLGNLFLYCETPKVPETLVNQSPLLIMEQRIDESVMAFQTAGV